MRSSKSKLSFGYQLSPKFISCHIGNLQVLIWLIGLLICRLQFQTWYAIYSVGNTCNFYGSLFNSG